MIGNYGPLALLAKYGFHLVTLSLFDVKKSKKFLFRIDLILIEAVELAKSEPDKKVEIILHTEEGSYPLSPEQIAALLI